MLLHQVNAAKAQLTHTHTHAHSGTGKRLFVFALLLFCLPIDLKITTTARTHRTALSNAKNIALCPIQHLQHPALPTPASLPLSYAPLCCVCVCLPTCVAHCAHCLHISPKTVHCAYLNFTARCGFSSKRFHLPTCCARPLDYHKRPTSPSPSPSTSSPLPHWPLARHTHHLPAMFARNS